MIRNNSLPQLAAELELCPQTARISATGRSRIFGPLYPLKSIPFEYAWAIDLKTVKYKIKTTHPQFTQA